MKKIIGVAAGFVILAGTLAGCNDKAVEPFKDAPRSYRDNGQPMDVIRGADGFSNSGSKCDGYGGRIFVAFHGDHAYAAIMDIPYGLLKPSDPCRNEG